MLRDDEDVARWMRQARGNAPGGAELAAPGHEIPDLLSFLSVEAWAARDIPPPDRLLGDLLTTTSRMFLVGRTGLGKTNLGFGIACGMASGEGFLHWRCDRPARVLYIDGEMPGELIKSRSIDVLRRATTAPPAGHLTIFARDLEDEFAARFPVLGKMSPLNTEAGQNFIMALVGALGGVDAIIFDNVMSLIAGDQKDEVPWSQTLSLIASLTAKRIGQVWLDHTGHNTDRQYGSSTKAWRFDAVGVMTPLPDDQRVPNQLAFTLSFEHPGKARRRTPGNWKDFETVTIRLKEDRWISDPTSGASGGKLGRLPPSREPFYDALVAAIGKSSAGRGETTLEMWEVECLRRGLIERVHDGTKETGALRAARFRAYRKAKSDLLTAKWIVVDEHRVIDLKSRWT